MWGFAITFGLGTILSIFSTFLLFHPTKFAISYSLGNILSILSTGFLVGPKSQVKLACAPVRRWSFVTFIGALFGTLISALVLKKALVVLLFVIVQFFAGLYYMASYIPYGRQILTSCAQSCLGQAHQAVTT